MEIHVSSSGPLSGKVILPGDRLLTLSLMAYGMIASHPLTILNPSPSPDVTALRNLLSHYGAIISKVEGGFTLSGKSYDEELVIDDTIPVEIVSIVAGGGVFSAPSVRIVNGASSRAPLVSHLRSALGLAGVSDNHIQTDGSDVVIQQAQFTSETEIIPIRSSWGMNCLTAGALVTRTPVTLSYPTNAMSYTLKLLSLMGCKIAPSETMDPRGAELLRRTAKVTGEATTDVRTFDWSGNQQSEITVPGDITLASAATGLASVIEHSNITVERVLWEEGRRGFYEVLRRMKGNSSITPHSGKHSFDTADIKVEWGKLEGIHLTHIQALSLVPELLVLGAVAVSAEGETVINDVTEVTAIGRETWSAFARELEKLGAYIGDYTDGIIVRGKHELRGTVLDSYGKEDVTLALMVAGLSAAGTTTIGGVSDTIYPLREFKNIIHNLSSKKVSDEKMVNTPSER